jgi:hypothetical protein
VTKWRRHSPVTVLFNRWIADTAYRQDISGQLGFSFSDSGLRKVSAEYGGSSFDGTQLDGRTDEMQLTQRWTHYIDDPLFQEIFGDAELLALSDALFGHLEGTERLRPRRKMRTIASARRPAPQVACNQSRGS